MKCTTTTPLLLAALLFALLSAVGAFPVAAITIPPPAGTTAPGPSTTICQAYFAPTDVGDCLGRHCGPQNFSPGQTPTHCVTFALSAVSAAAASASATVPAKRQLVVPDAAEMAEGFAQVLGAEDVAGSGPVSAPRPGHGFSTKPILPRAAAEVPGEVVPLPGPMPASIFGPIPMPYAALVGKRGEDPMHPPPSARLGEQDPPAADDGNVAGSTRLDELHAFLHAAHMVPRSSDDADLEVLVDEKRVCGPNTAAPCNSSPLGPWRAQCKQDCEEAGGKVFYGGLRECACLRESEMAGRDRVAFVHQRLEASS